MYVLVTYDISTESNAGKRRLRKVAKACMNRGQRVQNSVFECKLDEAQFVVLKNVLKNIIDPDHDSLRFYRLSKNYKSQIETMGVNLAYDIDGTLIL
ncbi:MAG: CRISPR-associated endonuclease Cas2 [Acidaminococcus sp.]|jgi:CRISPR-associated protein Cas2|nr:CRISPR-associated endonuclease Cas2 [Acidaminococcus sp.]MCI2100919.1 CRISPR-associated endonuclease Cas2 [Acidaminococcus sp.]MCI2115247.1 CRISPR-associated endonuclease Cas2 [Acidaminococcus sp.]